MALNYPGEYELRFAYEVDGLEHTMRHSVNLNSSPIIGVDMDLVEGVTYDGTVVMMDDWIESFLTEAGKQFEGADSNFGRVELWRYEPLSFDASFITVYTPTAQPSSTGTRVPAQQTTYSFRTREGGLMKIVLLETVNDIFTQQTYPPSLTNPRTFMDLIVNESQSPVIARDTSYPFAPLRMSFTQNESVYNKRYRF